MTREELEAMFLNFAGSAVADLSSDDLARVITGGQFITDCCLAEIERRGELEFIDGAPCLPYESDHVVETVLTRSVQ